MEKLTNQQVEDRKASLKKAIKDGRVPTVYSWFPGVEEFLVSFGIDPKKVYIPNPHLTKEQNSEARRRFRQKNVYIMNRGKVGVYKGNKEREKELEELERVKRRILNRLKVES